MANEQIYREVYSKIVHLTEGKIFNKFLSDSLGENVTSLTQAQKAFENRYKAYQELIIHQRFLSIMFAVYSPEFVTTSLINCCGDVFLSQYEYLLAKARIVENQKDDALSKFVQSLTPAYKQYNQTQLQKDVNLMNCAQTAVNAVQNGVYNCISITGLVILELRARGIPEEKIEHFYNNLDDQSHDSHVFVVVNRRKGSDKNLIETWGDDCYIIDPWYGYCGKAIDLLKDKQRFNKYYMIMNLENKVASKVNFRDDMLSDYIKQINNALEPTQQIPTVHTSKKSR